METIHKKNGKLHIYVRQDKYKGELKSHNWVGRTYINGKQKVSSSGTTNLEEAIPILEKWFDELQTEKVAKKTENVPQEEVLTQNIENKSQYTEETITQDNQNDSEISVKTETKGVTLSMLGKLRNFKLSKSKATTKDPPSNPSEKVKKNKLKNIFGNFFKSKVSKLSVAGEEIAGVDMTRDAIRVAQVSKDKDEKWILDKFSYRVLDQDKISENLLEHKDYLSEEIELAIANGKITTKNVAISIPVTSAIIEVIKDQALMTEAELKKAIETESLWKNIPQVAQITENLDDYSIFHQVINRNSKNNTMELLFVASKLADVNAYSSIAKKAGLNPVIMDVRCFTLKNAYDNTKDKSLTDKVNSAILELDVDENYIMIIHNNIPIITFPYLKPQEKQSLLEITSAQISNEADSVIRRYSMLIKDAINDYEGKHENKITSIQVVSSLKNIEYLIPVFKKNLPTTGFVNFDPLEGVQIPSYNSEKINQDNKSPLSSVLGLAYRKLDVFGYYKFVTAVKNINLLPNRDAIRQQNKLKFLSGFAFKSVAVAVAGIYLILIVLSFFQIKSNDEKLLAFDKIQMEFDQLNKDFSKLAKKKREMQKSLDLGKMINSNQVRSFISLAELGRSVPQSVKFTKITFDGNDNLVIKGAAVSDQDILHFIANLNAKSLIEQASLVDMKILTADQNSGSSNKKGFIISCKLKVT